MPSSTFLVDGARPARDAAQVKAGAELALGLHSAIFANFDGEFSGINQLYAGKGGFRYLWWAPPPRSLAGRGARGSPLNLISDIAWR